MCGRTNSSISGTRHNNQCKVQSHTQTDTGAIDAARKEVQWRNRNYGEYKHIMGKGKREGADKMTTVMTETVMTETVMGNESYDQTLAID